MNKRQSMLAWAIGTYVLLSAVIVWVYGFVLPGIFEAIPRNVPFEPAMSLMIFFQFGKIWRMLLIPVLIIFCVLIYVARDKQR